MLGGFAFGTFVWLLIFKLTGLISMSWWIVWLPVILYVALVMVVWTVGVISVWLISPILKHKDKD